MVVDRRTAVSRMPDIRYHIARRRVSLGFVFGIVALWLARPTPSSIAAGAAIAIAGEALRIWAAGHLEKGREVTMSGPYRMMRHPLYLGSSLIGVGLAIASASVAVTVLVTVYLVATMAAAIGSEEAHLTKKFGGAYPQYRGGAAPAIERRFSATRALRNREYRAVSGLVLGLAVLAWKALR
jgi:protein-S-isoprenylcysteine O-methyltransferase Ste14